MADNTPEKQGSPPGAPSPPTSPKQDTSKSEERQAPTEISSDLAHRYAVLPNHSHEKIQMIDSIDSPVVKQPLIQPWMSSTSTPRTPLRLARPDTAPQAAVQADGMSVQQKSGEDDEGTVRGSVSEAKHAAEDNPERSGTQEEHSLALTTTRQQATTDASSHTATSIFGTFGPAPKAAVQSDGESGQGDDGWEGDEKGSRDEFRERYSDWKTASTQVIVDKLARYGREMEARERREGTDGEGEGGAGAGAGAVVGASAEEDHETEEEIRAKLFPKKSEWKDTAEKRKREEQEGEGGAGGGVK